MKKSGKSEDKNLLRQNAEEFLKNKELNKNTSLTESEMRNLIHELQVHQIELEMQAEELTMAKEKMQHSLDKYTELYDFAPSGYFSLSERGEIIQLNLIGAQMLGKERSCLINKMFNLFISEDTRSIFNAFLKKTFRSKTKVSCEVSLIKVDNLPTTVLLSGIIAENGVECNITALDITDRKYAEKSLLDFIEKNPTSIQILNFEGYTIQTNLAHFNLFGAIVPEGYSLFNDPQLLKQGFGELFDRIKNGEVISFPDANYNPHDVNPSFPDKLLTIKAIGFSLKGTHGISERVVIMQENITEQKQAENKLQQSEENYRNLVESINDVVYEITNEGIIKYVTPSVSRVLGYKVEEVIGTNILAYIYDEDKAMIYERISKLKERDYSYLEYRYINKKGKICWVRSSTNAIIQDGKMIGASGILTDITERKMVEIALRISEEKYSKAFLTSPYAILITQLEDGKFFEVNDAFVLMSGYSREEALSDSSIGLNLWLDIEDRNRIIVQLREGKEISGKEYCFRLKDGNIITAIFSASIIYLDNKPYILSSINDITERKKIEDKLRISEEKYRNIFENVLDVYYEAAIDGTIIDVSPSIEFISKGQYTRDDLIGKSILNYYSDTEDRNRLFFDLKKTGKVTDYELPFKNKDGSIIPITITTGLFYDAAGNPEKIIGSMRDISSRKLAENELIRTKELIEESEKKFKEIIQSQAEGIGFININEEFEFANFASATIFETEENELVGTSLYDYLYPDEVELIKNQTQNRKNRNTNSYELKIRTKKGNDKYIHVSASPKFDENDNYVGAYGIFRDITDRKLAEDALQESEAMYRAIINASPDVITITDLEGKIIMSSPNTFEMFGYDTEEEIINKSLIKFIHSSDHERVLANLKSMFNGLWGSEEYLGLKKDGTTFDIEVNGEFIKEEKGQVVHLVFITRDISERKHAETEIKNKSSVLSNLIMNMQEGILLEDIDRKILLCNHLFCQMFGIGAPPEALLGADCSESAEQNKIYFINPEKFVKDIKLILKNKQAVFNEVLELIDGRFFERDYIPTFIENEYSGHLWKYRDITERKRNLLKLEESEVRFRQVVEQSEEVVWEVNAAGLFTYISPVGIHIYGYSAEQMIGKMHFYDLHPENDREEFKVAAFKVFDKKGFFHDLINIIIRPDGNEVIISTNGQPILDEKGILLGYRGIDADISERIKAEKVIKESEEKFRTITEQTNDLIAIADTNGFITFASSSSETIFHLSPEEMCGCNFTDFVAESDLNKAMASFREIIADEHTIVDSEFLMKRKDGSLFVGEINGSKYNTTNQKGMLVTIRDITERKQAEQIIQTRLHLSEFAQSHSRIELQQELLDELEKICNSNIGFFHAVNSDQQSLTLQCWSRNTMKNMCNAESKGEHYDIDKAGVWVDCVRERKAVIHNDYLSLPHRKGLPNGHADVIRELVVPVFRNEKVVAIVGVGNKPINYTDKDVEIVSLLSDMAWDIIERIGAEEELKKLSFAVEQSPVMICITDLEGNFEYTNPKATEMTGYSSAELLGKNARILKSGEKSKDEYRKLWKTIRKGKEWHGEFHNKRKNGELIWTSASLSPIFNSSGKIMNFLAVQEDITKRKQAEAEINDLNANLEQKIKERTAQLAEINISLKKEIEERKLTEETLQWNQTLLQLMSDSSPLGFLVVDNRTDDILYFNQLFCQIWGIEQIAAQMQKGELKNNDIIPYCLPMLADIPAFAESCKPLQEESNRIEIEDEISFTENRTVRRFSTQIRGENDKYYGRFYIFEDISERKRSEKALLESKIKHSSMISNISDVIGIMGVDGIMKYKSPNIERYFGWKPEDLEGKEGWLTIHPDDMEYVKTEYIKLLQKDNASVTLEYSYKCKDGSYKPIELTAINLVNNAIINGILLNYHDITERKKAENALKESEARFSSFMDYLPVVAFLKDHNGKTLFVNKYMDTAFGASEWVGNTKVNYNIVQNGFENI